MEITYLIIISLVAYIFGAITKVFIDVIPNKYIPIQNVVIGVLSGVLCFVMNIEPNILNSIIMCVISTMGAGGIADLVNMKDKEI